MRSIEGGGKRRAHLWRHRQRTVFGRGGGRDSKDVNLANVNLTNLNLTNVNLTNVNLANGS
jgi:uncharacterized protein YjbI with pentapeptide repeats